MRYKINTENYHNFQVYEINKLAPRSYFIPYPDRAQADAVSASLWTNGLCVMPGQKRDLWRH